MEVAENQTIQQKISASLHVTKLILNLALFCFAKNRLLLGFDLIRSGYSFWKNTKLKWISFSKTFPLNINSVTQAKVTYNMLVVPLGDSNAQRKMFDLFRSSDGYGFLHKSSFFIKVV